MKVDIVKSIIAIAISALLAYACYEICKYEHLQWVITIGVFLTMGVTLIFSLALSSEKSGSTIMLKTLSCIALVIEALINEIFMFFDFNIPVYVITNGIILLIVTLIYSSIYRTKM